MFSNDKLYETVQKADEQEDYCILAPHFFDEPIDTDTLEKSIEVVTSALQNLITNPVMREFFIGRKAYFTEKILQFKVGKTTVRAIPDLIMPMDKDHGIDIVDWKVATTSSSHHFQVGVYALAIRQTSWLSHYDLNNIKGYVINLLLPDPSISLSDPYTVQDDTLNYIIDSIYEKSEHVEALKQGRKFKELDISQFRYAKSEGSCATCNWCQLCKEIGDGTPDKLFPDQKSGPTQLALPLI